MAYVALANVVMANVNMANVVVASVVMARPTLDSGGHASTDYTSYGILVMATY